MTKKYTTVEQQAAFWSKVKKTPTCWLWTGARNPIHGEEYGLVRINGRTTRSHRVAYEFTRGAIPDGLCVLHKCDNPPCVRPNHLFLGTHRDNVIDRNKKGRMTYHYGNAHWSHKRPERLARGQRHGRYTKPECTARGEKVNTAKLSIKQVKRIRHAYSAKKLSIRKLAAKFNVCYSTVRRITSDIGWRQM